MPASPISARRNPTPRFLAFSIGGVPPLEEQYRRAVQNCAATQLQELEQVAAKTERTYMGCRCASLIELLVEWPAPRARKRPRNDSSRRPFDLRYQRVARFIG